LQRIAFYHCFVVSYPAQHCTVCVKSQSIVKRKFFFVYPIGYAINNLVDFSILGNLAFAIAIKKLDKKDIVRSNEVHVEQREDAKISPIIINKASAIQLQKDLEKLQDQKLDISHQISSIQGLKDRNSMQMLHYLNLEQSAIQNNILSIKTQMIEMAQA